MFSGTQLPSSTYGQQKKPHDYHKIAVWQKDDRIRKSPLKFYVYHYSEPSGDCQASIFLSFRCLIHETLKLLCWIYTTFISIFLLQFTETQVNHRVMKDRKYRITLCCSLILTFIKFITWHCCKEHIYLGWYSIHPQWWKSLLLYTEIRISRSSYWLLRLSPSNYWARWWSHCGYHRKAKRVLEDGWN